MKNTSRLIGSAIVLLVLAAGSAVGDDPPRSLVTRAGRSALEGASGAYTTPEGEVRIDVRKAGVTEVRTARWDAVGFFDGRTFVGLVRPLAGSGEPIAGAELGSLRFTYQDGSIDAALSVARKDKPLEQRWTRTNVPEVRFKRSPEDGPPPRVPSGDDPALGEYVQVDELPEAITKVPPSYPATAREKRVQGLVTVQVLVGKDGRVKDTRVIQSIPELDAAAVECVRQWVFKPALGGGKPVSVWVAVPIRFSLH